MTQAEKEAILKGLDLVKSTIENKTPEDSSLPDSDIHGPMIGPMFDGVDLTANIVDLPFDESEVESVLSEVSEAIRTQNRMTSIMDRTTDVLSMVRQLIPMAVGL